MVQGHYVVGETIPAHRQGTLRVSIPLAEVTKIATPRFNAGKTFAGILATGGAAVVALLVAGVGGDDS
jgi:hypothetical protein